MKRKHVFRVAGKIQKNVLNFFVYMLVCLHSVNKLYNRMNHRLSKQDKKCSDLFLLIYFDVGF